ncbi:hypothetical protein GGQ64_005212 [Rhizobium azooxidifex]|uniref:Uncharacterized protein n=1 Tax=Mycoplana azooxidifex TaxID=1636188 RepID=A0A7W6DG39_9HYPH|nr:hypothetical protein [Mycoplana azooxidifex]MBB3979965.1 hypothetical protein [Mycoplana azooxidifex]
MIERTTNSEITFAHPFVLSVLVVPLQAGTYRLVVDEELIDGASYVAYRRVATHLEIPAISVEAGTRQFLQVSAEEIASALRHDAELAMGTC